VSTLHVDTDALQALAQRLAATRDEVARAARLVDGCTGGSAAGLVAIALADFDEHWRYGLKRIVGNLDACQGALREAASAYAQVERAIAQAASGE
jgi:uncharacterized protein YukE